MKRVLNVGGNSKSIPLPAQYSSYQHCLLDIDPSGEPDIVCDARQLDSLAPNQFDAVYCSHNLEHYYAHDVPRVLSGFLHVLKEDGFVHIRVPDMLEVMGLAISEGLDIDDVLYVSPAGPITVKDMMYGYGVEIERSGNDFFAHKTGFTEKSLTAALNRNGFAHVFTDSREMEVIAIAMKAAPSRDVAVLFGLPT